MLVFYNGSRLRTRLTKGGLPVYVECSDAVYLGESIIYKNPQGHEYTEFEAPSENFFYEVSKKLREHKFR